MPRFPQPAPSVQTLSAGIFGRPAGASVRSSNGEPSAKTFPLNVGDTYLEPIAEARAEAQRAASRARLHNYAAVQGEPELLDAIARKLERRSGVALETDCIQVMSGATSGLGVVCTALLEPGDEVILPAPFWPLIRGLIRARGAIAVEVPLFDRLRDPAFDPVAAVADAITPRTAAIYLNSPHNPTGETLSDSALAGIGRLAAQHDLWVLSDEVYEDLYFGEAPPASIFARPEFQDRTIATHSLSKAYALAGARVGFTHGPRDIMAVVRGVQTFYTYCAPRPMQFGAAHALTHGDAWLQEARRSYASAGRLAARSLGLPEPTGGTFLFFDLAAALERTGATSGHDLLERCREAGVILTPGSACGKDYENWARLCFTVIPEAELAEALEILRSSFRLG